MTQKESYEDYVTPAREVNVYASSEVKQRYNVEENSPIHNRYKIINKSYNNKNPNIHGDTQLEKSIKPPNKYEYAEKVKESDEIKAKTENLWYDNEDKSNVDTIILSGALEKPKFGTRFPARHTYKATPNFVANLPVVVEKYNFNEPIPEADRERETLKYLGNPPASINKKVRLT
ncbi:jg25718 [Pararge aegeria aegeria]|uniref:Jg25718 protein n=3 Tax=Pararge aegeria TaxID=116150 RepID=A0A8S4QS73_9NEOP|nr:jg25718 [Pararge aegeria aegeria]